MVQKGLFVNTTTGDVLPAKKAKDVIVIEKEKKKSEEVNNKKGDIRISSNKQKNQESAKGTVEEAQILDSLAGKSERILMKVRTVFPFTLFPTEIVIDTHKMTIIFGIFFYSFKMFPIIYKDIRTVTVTTGLLFGSIALDKEGYEENPEHVNYLWREDALRLRRVIMGMMVATKEGVDLNKLDDSELLSKVEEIGRARENET